MSTLYADGSKDRRNDVETFDFDGSLVAAFEEVVTKFPSRIALCTDVWKPTYWELNDVANTLAYRLIALSVSAGDRVAILMSHDAPLVAAVLGTLKAGLIVIVLNPEDPITRLKTLLEDGEPSAIVTDAQNQTLAVEIAGTRCRFLNFESDSATKSIANPLIEILPRQTAFLTYTSGTTGRPKAVMQTHRQLRRAAVVLSEAMGFAENDRIPLFASISTGQGAAGVWWILLNGATGYPFPVRTRGVTGLADWIINQGLTVYISSA
jgi:non-ribosomal peptide synthetase component F